MFIDKWIKKFLNNKFIQTPQLAPVPKKKLIIILSHLGKMSKTGKTKLTKAMSKHIKFCKLGVIFHISKISTLRTN